MRLVMNKFGQFADKLISEHNPWTNVYGLARSILALGTLLTLFFNHSGETFRPAAGSLEYPVCEGVRAIGVFCLFSPNLELARWLSILILLVVISGWRPRYTGIIHWWVAFSLQTSGTVLDGGDQVTAVLTFLLLPLTLTDNRRWHWHSPSNISPAIFLEKVKFLVAIVSVGAIRLQVSIIYFHAATAKFALEEWIDGTILYYWLSDPLIGLPNWLKFTLPIYSSRFVVFFTWGTLLLEVLLFMGLLMPKKYWKPLLIAGLIFHGGIAFMMGLISFGCAMTAALILYLRPIDKDFNFGFLPNIFTFRKNLFQYSKAQSITKQN
jgi:antimicrobial peptide system SdpB family protein